MIKWAGVSSDTCGVVVERYPDQPGGNRVYEKISVPGRNGELLIDTGALSSYTQKYSVWFKGNPTPESSKAVRSWLVSPVGFQELEDSYDPDFFRLAYYAGSPQIENIMNKHGRMQIDFVCKPERYSKEGQEEVAIVAGETITNPFSFTSKPLIKVTGTAAGSLNVGDFSVQILALNGDLYLDSDTQNAYAVEGSVVNKNSDILTDSFPLLVPGGSEVNWNGGITGVTIVPRWWTV